MDGFAISGVVIEQDAGWRSRLQLPGLASYIGFDCVAEARTLAAVDTGAMKGSLRYDVEPDSTSTDATVEYSANTYYAIFLELGTVRAPAQPFVLPALRPGVDKALREWRPGRKRAMDSGATITAKEAGMDRGRRSTAASTQVRRDLHNEIRQDNASEGGR